ncbi:hypothetical protein BH09PAT1_BH09PAT1_2470 [soil metagenome]
MNDQDTVAQRKASQRLISRAYYYMRFRLRTEKEMQTYLEKKAIEYSYALPIVDITMRELRELGYLDDRRFVESFILSHQNAKQKGKFLLRNELMHKGISEDIIDNFFVDNPLDEESLALQALKKRWPRLLQFDRPKRLKKSYDFLRRKGFGYDTVKKTIEEMEEKG